MQNGRMEFREVRVVTLAPSPSGQAAATELVDTGGGPQAQQPEQTILPLAAAPLQVPAEALSSRVSYLAGRRCPTKEPLNHGSPPEWGAIVSELLARPENPEQVQGDYGPGGKPQE